MAGIKNTKRSSVFKAKPQSHAATQEHLQIGEIKKNVVVLKDGSMRAVLRVSSVNFNLKSEDEQNAIIYGYQDFLNSLDFPLQILVRSRKLSIDSYVNGIEKQAQKQTNALLKKQTYEYLEYIKKLIDLADIMKKDFYVVVTYDPPHVTGKSFIEKFIGSLTPGDSIEALRKRWKGFETNRRALQRRVSGVKAGLANSRLQSEQLKTQELIELYYEFYNPVTSREEKLSDLDHLKLMENDVTEKRFLDKEEEMKHETK